MSAFNPINVADLPSEGLTVAILAYNEAPSLEATTEEMVETLRSLGIPYEIFLVDDGSHDGTPALADQLATRLPGVFVVHHEVNRGIGPSFRTGITSGHQPLVTVFAGDGQFPADIIKDFLPHMKDHDMVLGYVPDIEKSRPALLILFSRVERLMVRILFGRFPRFQGVMMFRRSLLDQFALTSEGRGWIIQMEIVLRAVRAKTRIASVPTPLRPRLHGSSRATSLRNIISNIKQLVSLWFRLCLLRR